MSCPSIARRPFLFGLAAAAAACASPPEPPDASAALGALAARAGGRLGAAIVAADGALLAGWGADDRFGMCSTFKLLLAGAVLREADAGRLALDETLPFTAADLVVHAPVTKPALAAGRTLTIAELAEAGQRTSDNVAANLLIRRLGGPEAVTALWRAMGDPMSRIDRYEPSMNLVGPGEARDTTTPAAVARHALALAVGGLLSAPSRARLVDWMVATDTGLKRIRAGLPPAWRAGDKTGTVVGPDVINRYNDVAVVWPPGGAPLAIAAYYEAPAASDAITDENQAVLAEVGRIAAALIAL